MDVKDENICRLCLNVAENDFQIIDDISRVIFEVLSIRVNLDVSKDPIVCKDCAKVVEKCFNFKSACIDTEKRIISFAINKNRTTLKLKHVRKDIEDLVTIDDNFICRFCSNDLSGNNFISLDTLMKDGRFAEMLQQLMPEMDLDIIEIRRICTTCKQNLEYYAKFVENCSDVEEKITKYLQNVDTNSSAQIKLSDIPRVLFKNISELDNSQKLVIKEEVISEDIAEVHSKEYAGEIIKTEEIDIKEEEVNFTSPESRYNCDIESNTISSETRMGKVNETKYEVDNKKTIQMSTAHIFKCAMCPYKAKHNSYLRKHMLIHKDIAEVKMYKCSMCTYQTKYNSNIKCHMVIHKDITEVEIYKCTMCTYETKRKSGLINHTLIHKDITELKMYKCPTCTYQTRQNSKLKSHILIHKDITEVELYKCSICLFQTKHKRNLKIHMLKHKDATEVEMYKCTMCTYETKQKSSLKKHMLIHKDITEVETYKCTMCTYETKYKSNIKSHMLIHKDSTQLEMFKCTTCTYETKYKRSIKCHMLIHKEITEMKMYNCKTCSYQTKYKSCIKRHKCKN